MEENKIRGITPNSPYIDDIKEEKSNQHNQRENARNIADKYIKKHKKEISRLREHATNCLIANNKNGYIYAISKLRVIMKKSVLDKDTLNSLYITSKEKVDDIIRAHSN